MPRARTCGLSVDRQSRSTPCEKTRQDAASAKSRPRFGTTILARVLSPRIDGRPDAAYLFASRSWSARTITGGAFAYVCAHHTEGRVRLRLTS